MKKITAILLLSLYSLTTLGLSLKSFYCCGKLKSVSVTITQDHEQKCAKGDETSDCCQNKFRVFKVKDNHIAADHVNSPIKDFAHLNFYGDSYLAINYPSTVINITCLSNPPPLQRTVPDYIFNCVFRI